MKTTIILLLLLLLLSSCGDPASGSSIVAIEIPGAGGTRCFAIVQDGKAVGGNCIE